MIKCLLLTGLLLAAACGGGTSANPPPSPSQNSCPKCVTATGAVTFTGDVAGIMTLNSNSVCSRTPEHDAFELDFFGTGLTTDVEADKALSGKEWVLVVDGTVGNPDAVDAGVGPTSFHLSIYLSHAGQGTTHSTVTMAQDMRSGSLNLQLKGEVIPREGAQTRVTGTFTCAFT